MDVVQILGIVSILLNILCMVLFAKHGDVFLAVCWAITAVLNTITYVKYEKSKNGE